MVCPEVRFTLFHREEAVLDLSLEDAKLVRQPHQS
jgi:hypothetical protein